ncbi:MAG TPA: NADH-quinone oxidoreductase subunit H [Candidatus Limnocylindrales bacterium]|nr:NADH-quinone oxidoreductase subunit H [Candidatus Limnocylindrales bacterium]
MAELTTFQAVVLGLVQVGLVLLIAPLLLGVTKRVKARLQYRRGPSLLQPYADLAKWWRKEVVESDAASPLTAAAPAIGFAALLLATFLVPIVGQRPPLDGWGDLLVVVGLLALGRFVLALAALDSGSAFGGMGSSREVAIAALVEPALVLALAGAAVAAGSTDLGVISRTATGAGFAWYVPAVLLAAAAYALVAVAETGHEPVDNPDTHLELTMIHEGMLLEASGPRLAILAYTAELKLVLVAALFAAAFAPAGAAGEVAPIPLLVGLAAAILKLVAAAVVLGVLDATLPKLRILALPGLLATASILAAVGLAARIWLVA